MRSEHVPGEVRNWYMQLFTLITDIVSETKQNAESSDPALGTDTQESNQHEAEKNKKTKLYQACDLANKKLSLRHLWKQVGAYWNASQRQVGSVMTIQDCINQHKNQRWDIKAPPSGTYKFLLDEQEGLTMFQEGCRFLSENWVTENNTLNHDPLHLFSVKGLAGLDNRFAVEQFLRELSRTVTKISDKWGSEEIVNWTKSQDHAPSEHEARFFGPLYVGHVVYAIRAVIAIFAEDLMNPRDHKSIDNSECFKDRWYSKHPDRFLQSSPFRNDKVLRLIMFGDDANSQMANKRRGINEKHAK